MNSTYTCIVLTSDESLFRAMHIVICRRIPCYPENNRFDLDELNLIFFHSICSKSRGSPILFLSNYCANCSRQLCNYACMIKLVHQYKFCKYSRYEMKWNIEGLALVHTRSVSFLVCFPLFVDKHYQVLLKSWLQNNREIV